MTMFGTSWAWGLTIDNAVAKLVAFRLGDACDANGFCFVAFDDLCEFACGSDSEVAAAIEFLIVHCGVIHAIGENGKKGFRLPEGARPKRLSKRILPDVSDILHHLYIVTAGDGRTKIGITSDLDQRLNGFRTSIPFEIKLAWTTRIPVSHLRRVERATHETLAEHRIAGEWFVVTADQAERVVRSVLEEMGLSPQ